jgi:flagellar biosynthesis protein FlhB
MSTLDPKFNVRIHTAFILISGKCASIEVKHNNFISFYVRIGCLITLFSSAATLIYASFNSKNPIGMFWEWFSVAQLIPFTFGILYTLLLALIIYESVSKEMTRLIRIANL